MTTDVFAMRSIVLLVLLSQMTFPVNAQVQSRTASATEIASLFDASESLPREWRSSWPSIGGSSRTTLDATSTYPSFPSNFKPLVDYNALVGHLNTNIGKKVSHDSRDNCTVPKKEETTIRVCRREFRKSVRTMRAMEKAGWANRSGGR